MTTKPPFRADHVGSLLRPASVHEAHAKLAEGKLSRPDVTAIEDEAILELIAKQEAIGLKGITDGELRRKAWQHDFLGALDGVTEAQVLSRFGDSEEHMATIMNITGKIGFPEHPMLSHFEFLKENTKATAKMTIPSPAMLATPTRDWRETMITDAYSSLPEMLDDLAAAYRAAVQAFYDKGCRYLQFDDCAFAFMCDENVRQRVIARGDDPIEIMKLWASTINASLEGKPADMTITTHMCRGNFRSGWLAQGGYEFVSELIFSLNYDGFFLEYDTDRAGGFEPLRELSESSGQRVVLGLVTTKAGDLEDKDQLKRRVDEATKYVDLDRLCLSPQCGFASTEEGNSLTEDQQWRKLSLVVETADEIWC